MDNFLNEWGISITEGSEANYYSNFIAAYCELAAIAFSRKLNRALRYKAMEITSEYLGKKMLPTLSLLAVLTTLHLVLHLRMG